MSITLTIQRYNCIIVVKSYYLLKIVYTNRNFNNNYLVKLYIILIDVYKIRYILKYSTESYIYILNKKV